MTSPANLSTVVADQCVAIVSVDPANFRATAATGQQSLIEIDTRYHVGAVHVTPVVGDQWIVRRFGPNWILLSQLPANTTELLAVVDIPTQGLTQVGSTNPTSRGPLHLNGSVVVANAPLALDPIAPDDPIPPEGTLVYDPEAGQPVFSNGEGYQPMGGGDGEGGGGPVDMADISGLQDALDAKVDENPTIIGATRTKITYDDKGLVTAGANAGVADITGLQVALNNKINVGGLTADQVPPLDASKIVSGEFDQSMVADLVTDLAYIFATITAPITAEKLQNVPVGSIGLFHPELLTNPSYDTSISVVGGSVWDWDPTVTHTPDGTGSVKVTANGTILQLLSDPPIPVSPDQVLALSHWLQWSGVFGTGVCFKLSVVAYLGNGISNLVDLAAISNPSALSGWTQLSGSYTVPPTAVDNIRLQLTVNSSVALGTIWWDDGSVKKTQLLQQEWIEGLLDDLGDLQAQINARLLITDFYSLLNTLSPPGPAVMAFSEPEPLDLTETLAAISARLSALADDGRYDAGQLTNVADIPQLDYNSVAGIEGAPNIGVSVQQTRDTVAGTSGGAGTLPAIQARLANLDTTGSFDASGLSNMVEIPAIPGTAIPALDATKIVTGVLDVAQVPTDSLNLSNIADLQELSNQITTAFNPGAAGVDTELTDARGAMDTLFNTTQSNAKEISKFATIAGGAANSGMSATVDFGQFPNSNQLPPSEFTNTTYTGTGTSSLGVLNGAMHWYLVNNGSRIGIAHHNQPTLTDYQHLTSTLNLGPEAPASGYIVGRCNNANNTFLYIKVTNVGFLAYAAELGCFVGGVRTIFIPPTAIPVSYDAKVIFGTGSSVRNYQLFVGTDLVFNYTEVGAISQLGPDYRFWGLRGETNGVATPPQVTILSAADNKPPTVVGSGARIHRVGTGTRFLLGGHQPLLSSFFDTADFNSGDIQVDMAAGSFRVANAGWYNVSGGVALSLASNTQYGPTLYVNGQLAQWGACSYAMVNMCSTWVVYLNVNDYVQLGTYSDSAAGNILVGDSTGTRTYFSIALINRSLA